MVRQQGELICTSFYKKRFLMFGRFSPNAHVIFRPALKDCELQSCEWPMGGALKL